MRIVGLNRTINPLSTNCDWSLERSLVAFIFEISKGPTDNNKAFGALLPDILNAFDCLSHDPLISNGLDIDSLNILQDYLSNRKKRTKVDSVHSPWEAILSRVPQGSVFGPLLFNTFICDMFLILKTTYYSSYADDNTPFAVRDNIKALEEIGENLVSWFLNKSQLSNKCHLLLNSQERTALKIGGLHINNSLR